MPSISADLILINGRVATLDEAETVVEAVACWNGRIVATGTSDDIAALAGPATRTVDLNGRTVVPGLIDSHCHPDSHAIIATRWHDVKPERTGSIDALLTLVREQTAGMDDDDLFIAWGWNDKKCGGYPSLVQLDEVSHGRAVYIGRTDGHIAVVNTAMLRRMGIPDDAPDPPHGVYDRYPRQRRDDRAVARGRGQTNLHRHITVLHTPTLCRGSETRLWALSSSRCDVVT